MNKSVSVRIRKAGEGEKPGFYSKNQIETANFLKKAKVGMQVGSPKMNQQERIKVIMMDTYAALRDGADPDMIFQALVTKYGMEQQMAFQVINTVMSKLAEQGFVDPAYNQEEEEAQAAQQPQGQQAAPQQAAPGQPVGTPDEDEELAMSMADESSGYDGLEHLNGDSGVEEMQQEGAFRYGGSYDEGGYADEYANYFADQSSPEDTVIDQYSNPGELSENQQEPFSLEQLIRFTPGAQNYPETPDLAYYLGNYTNVADGDIPTDLLPMSEARYGGAFEQYAKGGVRKGGKGKKGKKDNTTEVATTGTTAEPEVRETPTITVTPQATVSTPNMWQGIQNAYSMRNPISSRGILGTTTEMVGTGLNYIRPQNWRESWRQQVAPSTTATKTLIDINNLIKNKEYEPEVLQKNEDGTYSSGLAFNMGPELSQTLFDAATSFDFKGKSTAPIELSLPTSKIPELNFLSLHTQGNNTKIRLVKDSSGHLKAELITDVKTKLKGYDKNSVTIKDEFYIDPENKQLIDPKTGYPLELLQKSFYTGNQLNWYNNAFSFPFTPKYPNLSLESYPKIISTEALKKEPASKWNNAWNLIGKPALFTPWSLPFTYPGFAARSKYYPNASKVDVGYLGRQREVGPQAPGGMTFGDQPFGTQYADYNLLRDRNYLTGKSALKTLGILGGLTALGYNMYDEPDPEYIYDRVNEGFVPRQDFNFSGAGRSFDTTGFGINIPIYQKDSMYISPKGDTIHDKGWGAPLSDDFKKGGALKKQFVKKVTKMFAPGGEADENAVGRGNRMDTNTSLISNKKKSFIDTLKTQSDKAATEDLYDMVQKSGDPNLMNIFMGQDQNHVPQQGMQPQMQPQQFGQEGGFTNMDAPNPLTRFIYGGDEVNYYEPYNLPEARDGRTIHNKAGEERGVPDMMSYFQWSEGEQEDWEAAHPGESFQAWKSTQEAKDAYEQYQNFYDQSLDEYYNEGEEPNNNVDIMNMMYNFANQYANAISQGNNCGPGTVYNATYKRCIPVAQVRYNPRIVRNNPGLASTLLPWNPIFRGGKYYTSGAPFTLKDLQKYTGQLNKPVVTIKSRKNWFSPKTEMDIYNPDGIWSKADLEKLMEYQGGKGAKGGKGSKNLKINGSKSKEERLSKTERIDQELMKDDWNREHWNSHIANNKSNLRNARRNFAFDNPEFRRFSDKIVFGAGQPGYMVGTGDNARWEHQGNYYESNRNKKVKEKKNKSKEG